MNRFIKICFFAVILILSITDIMTAQKSDYLKFENRHIELGRVVKGSLVDTIFRFTNASNEIIQIDIIDACECTTLEWTVEKIYPGEKGIIHVIFDSGQKDKSETIDIDITLINTDPRTGGPVMDNVSYDYLLIIDN